MNLQKGQSMFELVVAIAICALIIVAIVSLTTNSIRNSSYSKNKALAATYAQQATEWLRGQRDSGIDAFITNVLAKTDSARCLNDLSWITIASCPSGSTITGTPFQRDVIFTIGGDAETVMYADIKISWSDSAGLHQITSATSFSDWRQR